MPLVHEPKTMYTLRFSAIGCYCVAVAFFTSGLIARHDTLRDLGLAIGIAGVVVDLRHYTARGINRVTQVMSLWQDSEQDAQHRRDLGA